MKVVVTGGLGHIGSALLRDQRLVSAIDHIVVIDDLSTQRYVSLRNLPAGPRYQFLEGDVCSRLTFDVLEDAVALVHLAGTIDPTRAVTDPQAILDNNLRITTHAADMCAETHVPLIFSSSTSVYTPSSDVVDESSSELFPASPYAKCKLQEEGVILQRLGPTLSLVLRFGTIFGTSPGMRFQTAVNKFCWHTATGTPINVWNTAMDQLRPYLDVKDAAGVLARAAIDRVFPHPVVNAATCNVTVRDVIRAIESCGYNPTVEIVDHPIMNSYSFQVSTKLAEDLGFEFSGDLEAGIRATLATLGRLY